MQVRLPCAAPPRTTRTPLPRPLPGDVGVFDRAYNNFPVLFRQTLQLQSFFGEDQNAVEWQIWAAMLTHLVRRYIKWKNGVVSSYTRFAAIIKNTIWPKRYLEAVINFYCIAPGQSRPPPDETMPYLPRVRYCLHAAVFGIIRNELFGENSGVEEKNSWWGMP